MTRIALIAAAAALLALPAAAQTARLSAIEHFNLFADNASEIIAPNGVGTQAEASGAVSTALDVFNGSKDGVTRIEGRTGVTLVSGTPEHGAEIFDRLNAADDDRN